MNRPCDTYQIAVPTPLRRLFDYLPPTSPVATTPGMRVWVPFGGRELIGVVTGVGQQSQIPEARLKRVSRVLDDQPVLPATLFELLLWAADYYQHPIGEVIHTALPVLLRQGRAMATPGVELWVLSAAGRAVSADQFRRAPLQRRLYEALQQSETGLTADKLRQLSPNWRQAMKAFTTHGWAEQRQEETLPEIVSDAPASPPITPNPDQQSAIDNITSDVDRYRTFLLYGITGSGKTEVYLSVIESVLARDRQVLVLVPEIGLTPQLIQRFRQRLSVPVGVLHSGLSDGERHHVWWLAYSGRIPVVLGTRSAVFTPMPRLGLIVIDEEHDSSYKQQEGFRYHARDIAIVRAHRAGIPVVLGSATPSLESMQHGLKQEYQLLSLPERTGSASMPDIHVIDLRRHRPVAGLSHPLQEAIRDRLQKGEQSLIFLNRRGFAPVLMCHHCGWVAPCPRCDAYLTFHKSSRRLWCHHCGSQSTAPEHCPDCGEADPHPLGEGTERLEEALQALFPQARIERIDRDSIRRKGELEDKLQRIQAGEVDIVVGTQMLAKGHDFPGVTLVGVINADQGLYSVDFRAGEKLFQLLLQVCGRAGRGDRQGQVLIQSYHPDNPLFAALQRQDYRGYAEYLLEERKLVNYPPFAHLALLRAESTNREQVLAFVQEAQQLGKTCPQGQVSVMDPVPSPMERRAGRYRAQLLVQSGKRADLHRFLKEWLQQLDDLRLGKRVRWSLDVDPIDLY